MSRSRNRDERGLVSVVVAISALALIVVAALVIDGGSARLTRRASQNAADAASLAGVNKLYPASGTCTITTSETTPPCFRDAVKAVKDYASYNITATTTWASCTDPDRPASYYIVAGQSPCISFDSVTSPTVVRARIPVRDVVAGLGSIALGRSSIPVSAKAEASIRPGTQCALCILGDVTTNNSDYLVIGSGGAMAIRGNVDAGPNGVFNASPISVAGTVSGGQFPSGYDHVTSVPDPFASMPLPLDTSNTTTFPARNDPCASVAGGGGQGIYGNISLPNGPCTLQSGIYVITGAWTAGNNTALTSNGGVTLYVKASGRLEFKNGGGGITPMTTGPTAGFVLIADRDATAPISLQGNGGTGLTGKIYAPNAELHFNGTSDFLFSGGPVVIGGSDSVGNSTVKLLDPSNATLEYTPPALSR